MNCSGLEEMALETLANGLEEFLRAFMEHANQHALLDLKGNERQVSDIFSPINSMWISLVSNNLNWLQIQRTE